MQISKKMHEAVTTLERDLALLNTQYHNLTPEERLAAVFQDFDKVLVTSSFGSTSLILLDMIARVKPGHPVWFINTGFHFKETLYYKDMVAECINLQIAELRPENWRHELTASERMWESHPDLCCSVNKVEPLEEAKAAHEVWISGLMGWQADSRKDKALFEQRDTIIKFHPIIDMSGEEVRKRVKNLGIPQHPLLARGFESIGCTHCTQAGKSRSGRWQGKSKTECGLHW